MAREIYQEISDEWKETIAIRYPELASMRIFDCFDAPYSGMADLRKACRVAEKMTGRRFSVLVKEWNEKNIATVVQVKRLG